MMLLSKSVIRLGPGSCSFIRRHNFILSENKYQNKQQKYMRNVLKKSSGCILFEPFKCLNYIPPKLVSDENKIINNLELAVKELQAHRKHNQNVLTSLDKQCVNNFKNWPINEQLYALDVWDFVRNEQFFYSPCFTIMVTDFLNRLNELSNGHALQIMYYIAQSKRTLNSTEEDIVMKKMGTLEMNEKTFEEISLYCIALFLTDVQINDSSCLNNLKKSHLVDSLYLLLMCTELKNVDPIGVTCVIKAVRRFSTTHWHQIKALQRKLVPFAQEVDNLPCLTHIIQLGCLQRIFNEQLMDVIMTRFLNNLNELRIKDIERVLLSLSTCNRNVKNDIEIRFYDEVQKYLLISLHSRFPSSLIQCISYLTILNVVDMRLIEWALQLNGGDNIDRGLLLIDTYAKINLRECYTGPTLSKELLSKLSLNVKNRADNIENEIKKTLNENDKHCIIAKTLPYDVSPEIYFGYNRQTHQSVDISDDITGESILNPTAFKSKEEINCTELERIVIVPCFQDQNIVYTNRYTGLYQLKLDQLRILGFRTIVIEDKNFQLYKTPDGKRRYLLTVLNKNDVFLLNKMLDGSDIKSHQNNKIKGIEFSMKRLNRSNSLPAHKLSTLRKVSSDDLDDKAHNKLEVEPEQNFIKLIGKAFNDSVILKNGDQACKVIQRCLNERGKPFSIVHMLTLPKKILKSNGIENVVKNQKLNISGLIRSIPFTTSEGETKQFVTIIPNELKFYKDEKEALPDICVVLLTAYIDTDIWHDKNASGFNLRTHVPMRNNENEFTGELLKRSHSIVVRDPHLRDFLRTKNLSKDDYIFIEGHIHYQNSKTNEGKPNIYGDVIAVNIELIKKKYLKIY